jgi:hypothetical protein
MKSLDQMEPRTPISSLPFTISSSGSYYLTKNLQFTAASGDAITINSSNVTLDLEGFTLSSIAAVTGNAIQIGGGMTTVTVRNGTIAGNSTVTTSGSVPNIMWTVNKAGFENGISSNSNPTPANNRFRDLSIFGCRSNGINAGDQPLVESVVSSQNGTGGIVTNGGSVTNCTVSRNGNQGITGGQVAVSHCYAAFNQNFGVVSTDGTISNTMAYSNGGGMVANNGSINGCAARGNNGQGIVAMTGSVSNSTAVANGTVGISAYAIVGCSGSLNGTDGLSAPGGTITNSRASFNSGNGILATNGVVALCVASSNALLDISAAGATRTGNNPAP